MNPWSAQQREWLQALGHSVFVLAGSEDAVDEAVAPALVIEPGPQAVTQTAGSDRATGHVARPVREDAGRVQLARDAAFAPSRSSGADLEPAAPRQPPAHAHPPGPVDTPAGSGAGADPGRSPPARGDVAARAAALAAALQSGIPQAVPAPTATPADAEAIERLRDALLRATGRDGRDAETILAALGIDPTGLHANPAAKRALWPRLRRQRRQAQP